MTMVLDEIVAAVNLHNLLNARNDFLYRIDNSGPERPNVQRWK